MRVVFDWKVYERDNRRCWYDRHARTWFMQTLDESGTQVGECETDARKKAAMAFLNGKTL